jgi:acyl carrier protein
MTADAVVPRLITVLSRVAGPGRSPADAGRETPLVNGGYWLDSVALLEVIVACEGEFGIAFDPEADLRHGALATLGSLAGLIEAKRAPGSSR